MFTSWYTQRGNTETDMLRDYGDVQKLVHTERQHRDGYVERLRRCSEVGTHREATPRRIC